MSTVKTSTPSRTRTWGWIVLHVVNALLILNSVGLYFFVAVESGEQSAAILLAGLGFFGLVLAQEGYRHGSRLAWQRSWITTAVLFALGVNITLFGELSVGLFYFALTGITLLGQILSRGGPEISETP